MSRCLSEDKAGSQRTRCGLLLQVCERLRVRALLELQEEGELTMLTA